MINHLRTLLLNTRQPSTRVLGDEYVPAAYEPRVDNSVTSKVRRILFGTTNDRVLKNYRLLQLMPLIHGSELQAYSEALDTRLTYWPRARPNDFQEDLGKVRVSWVGSAPYHMILGNDSSEPGDMIREWIVSRTSSTDVEVRKISNPSATTNIVINPNDNLFNIPLSPSLSLSTNMGEGDVAFVTSLVPPSTTLPEIATSLSSQLTHEDLQYLWGGDSTLESLWSESKDLGLKLGSICVGTALRTQEERVDDGV